MELRKWIWPWRYLVCFAFSVGGCLADSIHGQLQFSPDSKEVAWVKQDVLACVIGKGLDYVGGGFVTEHIFLCKAGEPGSEKCVWSRTWWSSGNGVFGAEICFSQDSDRFLITSSQGDEWVDVATGSAHKRSPGELPYEQPTNHGNLNSVPGDPNSPSKEETWAVSPDGKCLAEIDSRGNIRFRDLSLSVSQSHPSVESPKEDAAKGKGASNAP